MRHLRKGKKLSREAGQRMALLKGLVNSLILHGRIQTTLAKAKAAAPLAEKIITKAKKATVAGRRNVQKFLNAKATAKIYREAVSVFGRRPGGYTRIIKTGPRKSDGAAMAILEIVK